ncbi:hypothetical protein TRIP_E250005 [uncultured Spirochaetota bacterium]|uniref:Uncharacterized protein n=1 Tax=uncultured Spirochaetota bacterium TaxID=460511 RepID=A0A652ZW43_9SPIR|nr:hypothetical protein TRIP_E250005 [uncultured Spirochaetota bacterium]
MPGRKYPKPVMTNAYYSLFAGKTNSDGPKKGASLNMNDAPYKSGKPTSSWRPQARQR